MKHFFITIALVALSVANVGACRCIYDEAEFSYFINAKYVFRAEIKEVFDCENNKYKYRLDVEEVFKGKLKEKIEIYTDCITSCAFLLEKNKDYLFFTDLMNDNIDFCEYRLSSDEEDYKNTLSYLQKIAKTKLDFLEIKNKDKKKIGELQIQEGKIDGLVKVFYPTGEMRLRGMYIHGIKTGSFEITQLKGKDSYFWKGDYENDVRVRTWIHIIRKANGTVLYEHIFYEDGEEIERHKLDKESQILQYAPRNE